MTSRVIDSSIKLLFTLYPYRVCIEYKVERIKKGNSQARCIVNDVSKFGGGSVCNPNKNYIHEMVIPPEVTSHKILYHGSVKVLKDSRFDLMLSISNDCSASTMLRSSSTHGP